MEVLEKVPAEMIAFGAQERKGISVRGLSSKNLRTDAQVSF